MRCFKSCMAVIRKFAKINESSSTRITARGWPPLITVHNLRVSHRLERQKKKKKKKIHNLRVCTPSWIHVNKKKIKKLYTTFANWEWFQSKISLLVCATFYCWPGECLWVHTWEWFQPKVRNHSQEREALSFISWLRGPGWNKPLLARQSARRVRGGLRSGYLSVAKVRWQGQGPQQAQLSLALFLRTLVYHSDCPDLRQVMALNNG